MNQLVHEMPYAIMFHHFKNDKHYDGQGAIDAEAFEKILTAYESNILSADEWLDKAQSQCLEKNDLCLSFDDNLQCQYDIALPILQKRGLKAFWFIYTQVYEDKPVWLELIRKFRFTAFDDLNDYYKSFFELCQKGETKDAVVLALNNFDVDAYLKPFPFYSAEDKTFRYLRNEVLSDEQFLNIHQYMMQEKDVDHGALQEGMWMSQEQVTRLASEGHIVGMHSHSHPNQLKTYSADQQKKDYLKNAEWIERLTGEKPNVMSHPVNSYNQDTLKLLEDMNIKLGFCSNMSGGLKGNLEWPREDHMNVLNQLL